MIEVQIFSGADGKISGFEVTGHSGTADRGEDIICAGVSSLSQSALLGIGEYLERDVDYSVESGDLYMKLREEPDELTEAIFQTMLLGIRKIEEIAPEAVRIMENKG